MHVCACPQSEQLLLASSLFRPTLSVRRRLIYVFSLIIIVSRTDSGGTGEQLGARERLSSLSSA